MTILVLGIYNNVDFSNMGKSTLFNSIFLLEVLLRFIWNIYGLFQH